MLPPLYSIRPSQFTLTQTETSPYLTFTLQYLTFTLQYLTFTLKYLTSFHLSLFDPPNEHSPIDFTTHLTFILLYWTLQMHTHPEISPNLPLSLQYFTTPSAHSPRDFKFSSSVILASSNSSSCVNLLTSDTRFWAAMSFSILARASLTLSLSSRALDFSDVVFLSFFFSIMSYRCLLHHIKYKKTCQMNFFHFDYCLINY